MLEKLETSTLCNDRLLDIIRFQTEVVQQGLDLGNVMALVAERSQLMTAAQGAVVELAEGEEMVYRATTGIASPQLGLRLRRDSSLSGHCTESGRAVFCEDSEHDPRVDREACRRVGLRSMIVSPLKHEGNVVGVLKVMSSRTGIFKGEDVQILELMSSLIAASMANATKYESDEIYHRATHDSLTGLSNRALFYDHLHQRYLQSQRTSEPFGVLILDMDNLKKINDHYGHRAGDAAIREFATRIREEAREVDTVARIGGDEFGILQHRIGGREDSNAAIPRLIRRVAMPFQSEHGALPLAASIGSAVFPEDGTDIPALVEKADQAMYAMKRNNKAQKATDAE